MCHRRFRPMPLTFSKDRAESKSAQTKVSAAHVGQAFPPALPGLSWRFAGRSPIPTGQNSCPTWVPNSSHADSGAKCKRYWALSAALTGFGIDSFTIAALLITGDILPGSPLFCKSMLHKPHTEHHLKSTDAVRDVVIGMSDGLTVPFALAAGLSGADVSTRVVVLAGLAEIAAGCIAMGLGGYLAARTDAEHYLSELRRETRETREIPDEEAAEVRRVFEGWGLDCEQIEPIVATIVADEERWIQFMMKF